MEFFGIDSNITWEEFLPTTTATPCVALEPKGVLLEIPEHLLSEIERSPSRMVTIDSSGNGIPPKYYKILLGKKVTKYLKKGTPVSWSIFWIIF